MKKFLSAVLFTFSFFLSFAQEEKVSCSAFTETPILKSQNWHQFLSKQLIGSKAEGFGFSTLLKSGIEHTFYKSASIGSKKESIHILLSNTTKQEYEDNISYKYHSVILQIRTGYGMRIPHSSELGGERFFRGADPAYDLKVNGKGYGNRGRHGAKLPPYQLTKVKIPFDLELNLINPEFIRKVHGENYTRPDLFTSNNFRSVWALVFNEILINKSNFKFYLNETNQSFFAAEFIGFLLY